MSPILRSPTTTPTKNRAARRVSWSDEHLEDVILYKDDVAPADLKTTPAKDLVARTPHVTKNERSITYAWFCTEPKGMTKEWLEGDEAFYQKMAEELCLAEESLREEENEGLRSGFGKIQV